MTRCILAALGFLTACSVPRDPEGSDRTVEVRVEEVTPRTPGGAAIEYTVRIPNPHTHYLEIEAVFPTSGADVVELMMAVWTPGSYLVREYARNIDELTATAKNGDPLKVEKARKNRWTVVTGGQDQVVVRYPLYSRELTVRTNFVDDEIAILNGAPTFVTLAEDYDRPYDILLELPESWTHSVTSLPPHPDGRSHHYVAPDFDILVDSPIVAGSPALYDFEIEGVPHQLANFGEAGIWDGPRSARDVEKLAATQARFWGVVPYERYIYLNVLLETRGGLEHRDSTLMLGSKWTMRKHEDYLRWLTLVSHEFFHTWNVKRLRPESLGPFDYENEVYTESLWIAEGITSYYHSLLLVRAGLMQPEEYLDALSKQIDSLQTNPGRQVQSLSAASYDAWIKLYRSNENSNNTTVNYYVKGAVVGFLLDAEIRRTSLGEHSLDDVMRLAYERYSGDRGYTPEQFRAVAEEVAGASLEAFWASAVDGTVELDYEPALEQYGLRFAPTGDETEDKGGAEDEPEEPAGWIGAEVGGDSVVTTVPRDTPAHEAGLNVGDEILAIGDHRVRPGEIDARLERYRPGDEVEVLVSRRDQLRRLPVELQKKPDQTWKLEIAPKARADQTARFDAWLSLPEG